MIATAYRPPTSSRRCIAAVVVGILLVLMSDLCLAADEVVVTIGELEKNARPEFRSDSDGRYYLLERVQADYCGRADSLPCTSKTASCMFVALQVLSARLGNEKASGEEMLATMFDFCRFHGTRFEATGSHGLLSASLAKVHDSAKEMSSELNIEPIIGSLPLREMNASASQAVVPIIFVNQRFFSFAADFARIVCLTIPVEKTSQGTKIVGGERDSMQLIDQSPTIREAMLYHLNAYMGGVDDRTYDSTSLCEDVAAAYTVSVLDFAVAHEYGHLALGHSSSLSTPLLYSTQVGQQAPSGIASQRSHFIRELEADAFAYRVLAKTPERFARKDESGFHKNYLGAIEFYFQVRDIFQDAAARGEGPTNNFIDESMASLARRIAACIKDPVCDVGRFEVELGQTFKLDAHPPARLRRAVAEQFRRLEQNAAPNHLGKLVDMLTRNAWLLWLGSRTEWEARKFDKAKFAELSSEPVVETSEEGYSRLLRAREDLTRLAKESPGRSTYVAGLNAVAGQLGDMKLAKQDFTGAKTEYDEALRGARKLAKVSGAVEDLSVGRGQEFAALKALASLEVKVGNRAEGAAYYTEAIPIAEGLLKEWPREKWVRESLAESLIQLANLSLDLANPDEAESVLRKLEKVLDEDTSRSDAINEMQSVRSELLWKLATSYEDTGRWDAAKAFQKLAVDVLVRLAGRTHEVRYQRLLAQRSTLLAFKMIGKEYWVSALARWEELERLGGLKDGDRSAIDLARRKAAH